VPCPLSLISLLEKVLPWERFVASVQEASTLARPSDFDYLDLLDDHYSHVRKYSPDLLETFTFSVPSLHSYVLIVYLHICIGLDLKVGFVVLQNSHASQYEQAAQDLADIQTLTKPEIGDDA
jgi:hypothetical protein